MGWRCLLGMTLVLTGCGSEARRIELRVHPSHDHLLGDALLPLLAPDIDTLAPARDPGVASAAGHARLGGRVYGGPASRGRFERPRGGGPVSVKGDGDRVRILAQGMVWVERDR